MNQSQISIRRPKASAYEKHVRGWMASHTRKFSAQKTESGELEILILDVIGGSWWFDGVTAKAVKAQLDANPDAEVIRVLIDSPGGDVFEGVAIQSLLKRSSARIEIEILGEASSAASVIAMAGDVITMHEGAMMMVHRASCGVCGFSTDLRSVADVLDKISESISSLYIARTGKTKEEIEAIVMAETWMTAADAVAAGFADNIAPAKPKASTPVAPPGKASPAVLDEEDEDEDDDGDIIIVIPGNTSRVAASAEPIPAAGAAITPPALAPQKESAMANNEEPQLQLTDEERAKIADERAQAMLTGDAPPTAEERAKVIAARDKVQEDARFNRPLVKAARPDALPLGGFKTN